MSRVRLSAAAALLVALLGIVGLIVGAAAGRERPDAATGPAAAPPPIPPELAILAAWDRRRAAAYAEGDADALARLYAAGSRTGAADVAMLAAYAERELVVRGMQVQVLAAELLGRGPESLELRVTDRLVGAEATGSGGGTRLPADLPSERVVRLVRREGSWLVAEVELSPAAPSR